MTLCYDAKKAAGLPRPAYTAALGAEGCFLNTTYWPVYAAPLLNLYDRTSPVPYRDAKRLQNYRTLKLPNTEKAVNETALVLSHTHLLGGAAYIDGLLQAVEKVNARLPKVARWWRAKQAAEAKS
jgi:hypothetical protein